MDGWTGTGQKIQPLSKQCQSYVKGLSKKRSRRGSVPLLSKSGQSSVKPVSSSRSFGRRLDVKIHCLSKLCPHEFKIMLIFALDSIWTRAGTSRSRDRADREPAQARAREPLVAILASPKYGHFDHSEHEGNVLS